MQGHAGVAGVVAVNVFSMAGHRAQVAPLGDLGVGRRRFKMAELGVGRHSAFHHIGYGIPAIQVFEVFGFTTINAGLRRLLQVLDGLPARAAACPG